MLEQQAITLKNEDKINMNYFEVTIKNEEGKSEKYLVEASTATKAGTKTKKRFNLDGEQIITIKLTKILEIL